MPNQEIAGKNNIRISGQPKPINKKGIAILFVIVALLILLLITIRLWPSKEGCKIEGLPTFETAMQDETGGLKYIYLFDLYFDKGSTEKFSADCDTIFGWERCKEITGAILLHQAKTGKALDEDIVEEMMNYLVTEGASNDEIIDIRSKISSEFIISRYTVDCNEKSAEADKAACIAAERYLHAEKNSECFTLENYGYLLLCVEEMTKTGMSCVIAEELRKIKEEAG